MTRWAMALVLAATGLLVGCQQKSEQSAEERQQALERRVDELEKQASASPLPSPEILDVSPEGAVVDESARVRQPAAPAGARSQPRVQPPTRTQPAPTAAQPPSTVTSAPASGRPAGEPLERDSAPARAETVAERESAPTPISLPAGTELSLALETTLSSKTSEVGDAVVARVERATGPDGRILLPGGTVLRGRVYDARSAGRVKGRARIAVDFDRITVRGRTHQLDTTAIVVEAPDTQGTDAKIIGGSAAAGAVIGALKGGASGAAKGAVVGAGAGTAAVLVTKGKDVELPAGSRWVVRVKDGVRL